jgi:hypothetical protein
MGSVAAVVIAAAACVDLSAPNDAPASISPLQVGSLFAVQGDVIRDTLGNASVLNIIAYDGAGSEVGGFTPNFFVIDSIPNAKLNADGTLTGTKLGTARVIGQIGNVQTPPLTIFITTTPTTLIPPTTRDSIVAPLGTDSASAIASIALVTGVRGANSAIIGGMFVRYEITKAPASQPGSVAVYLQDDNNRPFPINVSTPDTTDASGNASRKLVVNARLLAEGPLKATTATDTVVVQVTAKYKGVMLSGSPFSIKVPVKVRFGP